VRLKKELIFVDTNVVVWFLKGRPSVIEFFTENIDRLASNIIIYLEVAHVYRRLMLRLRRSVDLTPVSAVFDSLLLLPVDVIDRRRLEELIVRYDLAPNDAMIAATCEHYGIHQIATYDEDFTRVDFLKVIRP